MSPQEYPNDHEEKAIQDIHALPQFNGYFYWATMSPQEYPNDHEEKAIQDIHARIQTGSDPLDGIIGQTLIGDCDGVGYPSEPAL
jgi:hypothetical protein